MLLPKSLLSACLFLVVNRLSLSVAAPQQRPIQTITQGPNYSQQITFGSPGQGFQPLGGLIQYPPHLNHLNPQPQLLSRPQNIPQIQIPKSPTPSPSSPRPPTPSQPQQQSSRGLTLAFPQPSARPGGPPQGPILLKSPQSPILLQQQRPQISQQQIDEEYYDDDDVPARAPQPQARPQQQLVQVRAPQPSPQPQRQPQPILQRVPARFAIQQQQAQQQIQQQQQQQQQRQPQRQKVPQQQYQQQQQQSQSSQDLSRPLSVQNDKRLQQHDFLSQQGGRRGATTPPPVQTVNRYMRNNEDGSMSWGYENEDGTFKEETLGIDCVVRGKYGYVDPEGNKREYTYQAGNPGNCDPNRPKSEEELDEEEESENPSRPQQPQQQLSRQQQYQQQERLAGLLNARPNAPLQQRRIIQQQQQQ